MAQNSLGLVLRLTRMVGLAPYVRTPDYQVSRAVDICGKLIYTSISAFFCIAIVIDAFFNGDAILTIGVIHAGSRLLLAIIVLIANYTASERMSRMFRNLKQLEEIDNNISCRRKAPGDRKIYIRVLICLFWTFLTRGSFFIAAFFVESFIPLHFFILVEYQIMVLLEMQLIIFAARVLETLEMVNKSLEQLIPKEPVSPNIKKRIPKMAWDNTGTFKINTTSKICNRKNVENFQSNAGTPDTKDETTIRQLAKYYFNICDIVKTTTKADGYLMVLLLVGHMLNLEISWHKIIIWLSVIKNRPYYFILPAISRSILHLASLIFCTEVYHQTHEQMNRTHEIINYLKCRRADEEEVNNELELFVRLLLLNKTTYSPLKMCTLSRSLVVKIFGCLVTYLVIILTYGSESSAPSLVLNDNKNLFW